MIIFLKLKVVIQTYDFEDRHFYFYYIVNIYMTLIL